MDNTSDFSLKAELKKVRSLPKGKRWEYIWEYYRLAFFLAAFSLFFFLSIGFFLANGLINLLFPRDSFSIAFAAPGFSANQEWVEDCLEAIAYDEKREAFQILTAAPLSDASDDLHIQAGVWMANGQPDIFVVNEAGYRYLAELEALAVLPDPLRSLAGADPGDPFGLDITDTPMANAFALTEERVLLCMYTDGTGFHRALDVVEYILTEAESARK